VLVVGSEVPNLLMDASQDPAEAYVLEDDRLPLLVFGKGARHQPEPVARELEPPRVILFVPAARVARIAAARRLAVRLSAELLSAECLALVPFETEIGADR
jgi:hypothetical protein